MADPFVAEIRIFPFNLAPKGWAFCDSQLLPLSQNTALFSLLGTTYGGNVKSNFALPDLQGRAAMHPGQGPGLSLHDRGETGGSETVTLLESEMPAHAHSMTASQPDGTERSPVGQLLATGVGISQYQAPAAETTLAQDAVAPAGGDQPHNNLQPYVTMNFCIAMQGVFPPRGEMDALTLRPADPHDDEFLYRVYAGTRDEELAAVPWDTAQKQAFLRSQFDAQSRWYREHYVRATYEIVLFDGEPAGRLYLHRGETEIRIVDIALLPEHRGNGIGTSLLSDLLAEAGAAGKRVTVHVERFNPAKRLYARLGFSVAEDKGVYVFLEATPQVKTAS
jgi:microcystin-dependent protein/GNAT superfamily N-acetyltransferase